MDSGRSEEKEKKEKRNNQWFRNTRQRKADRLVCPKIRNESRNNENIKNKKSKKNHRSVQL